MENLQEALNIINQVVDRGVEKGIFTSKELRIIFAATDALGAQFAVVPQTEVVLPETTTEN